MTAVAANTTAIVYNQPDFAVFLPLFRDTNYLGAAYLDTVAAAAAEAVVDFRPGGKIIL
jgi:hypothetical protein